MKGSMFLKYHWYLRLRLRTPWLKTDGWKLVNSEVITIIINTADREAIVCIMSQCSKCVPHISKGFKYFEGLFRGRILRMEYLFEKKFRLILLWQYYTYFLVFSQNICFTIKDLPTTTICLSKKTLKQSSQFQNSNWYTYIIHLQRSDTCYTSSLYKSSIMRSVRLYIFIYVQRVWNILYLYVNVTNIKTNRIGGTCS